MHFERKCYILTKSVEGNNKKRNQTTETNEYGQLVKGLRRRPLTAETRVRFPYWLLSESSWKSHSYCFFRCLEKREICRCNQNKCSGLLLRRISGRVRICRTKMLDKAQTDIYNKFYQRSSGIDHRQIRREFPLLL